MSNNKRFQAMPICRAALAVTVWATALPVQPQPGQGQGRYSFGLEWELFRHSPATLGTRRS